MTDTPKSNTPITNNIYKRESELQRRGNLERMMRHQLNLICDEFPIFAQIHNIELDPEPVSLEADKKEGALLTLRANITHTEAAKYTDIFNIQFDYPVAKIRFIGTLPDPDEDQRGVSKYNVDE